MRVLAIDTALEACAAAVLDTESGRVASESQAMVRGHAEALMPLIGRVMRQANLPFSALDRIAVTVGPGSFTGMRVGISAARGIALATGKPAVGVTTLQAYAAPILAADDQATVAVTIDARHNHVYLQVYGPGGQMTVSPRLASIPDVLRLANTEQLYVIGTGAEMVTAVWPPRATLPVKIDGRRAPDIAWVGRVAAVAQETGVPPKPLYLRAPDARPQDAARLLRR
jgi:tRNA threonylcarbamoyl adenosine modification protein YeaZ